MMFVVRRSAFLELQSKKSDDTFQRFSIICREKNLMVCDSVWLLHNGRSMKNNTYLKEGGE